MTHRRWIPLAASLGVVAAAVCAAAAPALQAPNTLTAAEKAAGWRLLWDGKTLDGWHTYGLDKVLGWDISEGMLIALGKGGDHANDIVTNDDFESFELLVDWRVSPRANSGIFFHVVEQGHDRIYATGPEYQLIDEDGWPDKLEDWQKAGANYAMHPPLAKAARPVGEWNTARIAVNKAHVTLWLNGIKTAEYDLWSPEWDRLRTTGKWKDFPDYGKARTGKIGLQDHGNKVFFRNIKIRVL